VGRPGCRGRPVVIRHPGRTPEGSGHDRGSWLCPQSAQRIHGLFNLSRALQHGGDFTKAMDVLINRTAPDPHRVVADTPRLNRASCHPRLDKQAAATESASVIDGLIFYLNPIDQAPCCNVERFSICRHTEKAEQCWRRCIESGKTVQDRLNTRELANLADLRLNDADEAVQAEGLEMMRAASTLKSMCEISGSPTLRPLGLYYWRCGRFEPAWLCAKT
jgi:hypothetical protein